VILSHLISKVECPIPSAKKVLVLAHREELLIQACKQIKKFNPELVFIYIQKLSIDGSRWLNWKRVNFWRI
jgi:superfamily II DNA or RNA helicase